MTEWDIARSIGNPDTNYLLLIYAIYIDERAICYLPILNVLHILK